MPHPSRLIDIKCNICGQLFTVSWSQKKNGRKHCSRKCYGKAQSLQNEGKRITKFCPVCNRKFKVPKCFQRITYCSNTCRGDAINGDKHPRWKGGRDPYAEDRRQTLSSKKYRDWRRYVFQQDNYTCLRCDERGGILHAHHLYPWKDFPEKRYDKNNGVTLCSKCHILAHKK